MKNMKSLKQQKRLKSFTGSRVWSHLFIIVAMAVIGFNTVAAQIVPEIDNALPCGRVGEAGDIAPGNALFRVDVNLNNFPNAICNDGSGAVFYVRRYTNPDDRNKWHIHLQGGGGCQDGQSCAERWCSADTNFGADKMSTTFRPLPAAIRGAGIFTPDPRNNFAGWNHVLIYYCSSDTWSGTARNVQLMATFPNGVTYQYRIHFQGANIVEAVIKMLQRLPGGAPVSYRDAEGEDIVMPDLDTATHVLFTGTSAGSGGVRHQADRVGEMLRRNNVQCQSPGNCPLDFRAVIDAGYGPKYEDMNYANFVGCLNAPFLCDYTALMQNQWNNVTVGLYKARVDKSCVEWHRANQPGTEWKCADTDHVMENHITTPYFTRMDLQDELKRRNYVEAGFGTEDDFGRAIYNQLLNLPNLDSFAEEGSVMSGGAPLATPGIFGPQCTQHVGLTDNHAFFNVKVSSGGIPYSAHDVLWNWWRGQQPQQVVYPYTGPGPAPTCSSAPLVKGPIGFVGASFTNNAVAGYRTLGGQRFWETIPEYNGGSVSVWAGDLTNRSRYWRAFDDMLKTHPETETIWWQLCNSPSDDEETLYQNARLVLAEIQRRAPGAMIYASAQHSYSDGHVCRGEPDGPARMQRLAERLVSEGLVLAGPVMGPLAASQTRDGCHANLEGRRVLGQQLLAFFR